jgi:hypothetical protein
MICDFGGAVDLHTRNLPRRMTTCDSMAFCPVPVFGMSTRFVMHVPFPHGKPGCLHLCPVASHTVPVRPPSSRIAQVSHTYVSE